MLKYLFEATFLDQHVITQTPDDASTIDPTKSAIYDVLQYPSDLVTFSLIGPGGATVYLYTGHFRVNGMAFLANPNVVIPVGTKRRLIYYRDCVASSDIEIDIQSGQVMNIGNVHQRINAYVIGWQATVDGMNIQQTIAVE
jgi:hypothetical protein